MFVSEAHYTVAISMKGLRIFLHGTRKTGRMRLFFFRRRLVGRWSLHRRDQWDTGSVYLSKPERCTMKRFMGHTKHIGKVSLNTSNGAYSAAITSTRVYCVTHGRTEQAPASRNRQQPPLAFPKNPAIAHLFEHKFPKHPCLTGMDNRDMSTDCNHQRPPPCDYRNLRYGECYSTIVACRSTSSVQSITQSNW